MATRSERDLRKLLGAVEAEATRGKSPDRRLATFAASLFGAASLEDLSVFEPSDLAAIARDSLAFIEARQRGRHKVRVFNPSGVGRSDARPFSVIEIVNDDMPFLVESVLGELAERGLEVQLLMHPILTVTRSNDGQLLDVLPEGEPMGGQAVRESVIRAHVERVGEDGALEELAARFTKILDDTRTVVLDWRPMLARLEAATSAYQTNPPPVPVEELGETIEFLHWLAQNHFTLLGIREFDFVGDKESGDLVKVEGSDLGLMRDPELQVLKRGGELVTLTPEVRDFLMQPAPLIISKANVKSHVHRRAYMDYIGIKQFDESGAVKGELRVIGLFTSAAYTRSARAIPLLRRKVDLVLKLAGFAPSTHSGRALVNILESYPRDELFQIDVDTLVNFSLGILRLQERPRTRVFVRPDKFDRFVSALVYVPRDSYDTQVRIKLGAILANRYDGRVSAFYPSYPEGTLARVHFIIGRNAGTRPEVDVGELEADLAAAARDWSDNFRAVLEAREPANRAGNLFRRYGSGFSRMYEDTFQPETGLADVERMEKLEAARPLTPNLWEEGSSEERLNFRLYHLGTPLALTDRLPILQNIGFRAINERSYQIDRTGPGPSDAECIWLHETFLAPDMPITADIAKFKPLVEDAFLATWNGEAEDDGYNRLILELGRPWREVSVLRTVGRFLQQAGITFSQDYMSATLCRHSALAGLLLDLFAARFDPSAKLSLDARQSEAGDISARIEAGLEAVAVLDEDRIIRRFAEILMAVERTNYYQRDLGGEMRPAIAIKLSSSQIETLPKPRPTAEIFVYSPRVEGVHLRFGEIARGGLRWSDRPQDFRTEVLGLVKAQQVKNAVIVPVGAKGGFFPKRLLPAMNRDEFIAEGIACYKIFVGSLLDVTDNHAGDAVVPPTQVVRHDGDDPYLVVAADKGTATFSDIANSISTDRGFWLGDAFASGGSAGYDHKKMGITARGAWEAVKRHFREMDRNIQAEPFTCVGCGDMSGDVFGNGMLLSKQTRLLAAFDHRDIFIDPDPDPAKSYAERRRMFRLARSSWQDYNKKLISKGGGVFSRSLKSIKLNAEIKRLSGLTQDSVSPADLISALLKADVDLLWFGGIGTYIRASTESNAEVGDRANDPLRVTAPEVGAKVVGEGANLGATQAGRIEFAKTGGRINTDAIDNSAGVNTSDVEVNIKIALGQAVQAGRLDLERRNALLADMTDEVAALVLRNNYDQTLCLSLAEARGAVDLEFQIRLMKSLEARELLDRTVEGLPDDIELAERQARGEALTRPELAVLLAWAKIALFKDLVEGSVPDEAYFRHELIRYFPQTMRQAYTEEIEHHRLRREIIATALSNSIINHGGSTMVQRLRDETGAGVAEITLAFTLARDAFAVEDLMAGVDALDNKVESAVQTELYVDVQNLIRRQTVWFLRNVPLVGGADGLEALIAHYRQAVAAAGKAVFKSMDPTRRTALEAETARLGGEGVPKALAARMALLPHLARTPDIVQIADETGCGIEDVVAAYLELGDVLAIDWLLDQSDTVATDGFYERLALNRTIDQIAGAQRRIALAALTAPHEGRAVNAWLAGHEQTVERTRRSVGELVGAGQVTLAKLAVAGAYLTDLAGR